jgi:hypothetical protein
MVLIIMSAFASLKQGLEKGDNLAAKTIESIKKSPRAVLNSSAYGVGIIAGFTTGSVRHLLPPKKVAEKVENEIPVAEVEVVPA